MLNPGTYLQDRYEILGRIGSGGMSVVYKAKCHTLDRLVAIKVLKEEFASDENFVSKFKMEAQAAARLSHPNIVNVYDVVDEGDLHYIVMELIEGITLKNYIEKKGFLENKEAIGIAIQVAQGIAAAHEQHIIHRDIKPQNMIISKDGTVKVADFGIARAVSSQTMNATAVGSVHYISPEQARGGYCDERSDIYSFGITLYEMVTGRVPFEGDNTVAVALAHLEEAVTPPSQLNPMVSRGLEEIILKCTQKKPDRRYPSIGDVITDLRHVMVDPDYDIYGSGLETDEENDPSMIEEIQEMLDEFQAQFDSIRVKTLLSGEYDGENAIIKLNAGAGGTEACDWCSMLYRMYTRWAERKGFSIEVLDYLDGDEAGIKSVTFQVNGENAYGLLKSEKGVHRLVRISPFNAAGKRQTSFVSCDVMPDIEKDLDVEINDEDIRIDTYRSSGAGGQHINKTSSAIRITHFPTGIVVQCQNERSQHMNKDKAMQMLKAKLYLLKQQEAEAKLSGIRGEVTEIGRGNQIRSYVMQPYTMVKDHRTNEETGNVDAVMDGAIDIFINAYLKWIALAKRPAERQ